MVWGRMVSTGCGGRPGRHTPGAGDGEDGHRQDGQMAGRADVTHRAPPTMEPCHDPPRFLPSPERDGTPVVAVAQVAGVIAGDDPAGGGVTRPDRRQRRLLDGPPDASIREPGAGLRASEGPCNVNEVERTWRPEPVGRRGWSACCVDRRSRSTPSFPRPSAAPAAATHTRSTGSIGGRAAQRVDAAPRPAAWTATAACVRATRHTKRLPSPCPSTGHRRRNVG